MKKIISIAPVTSTAKTVMPSRKTMKSANRIASYANKLSVEPAVAKPAANIKYDNLIKASYATGGVIPYEQAGFLIFGAQRRFDRTNRRIGLWLDEHGLTRADLCRMCSVVAFQAGVPIKLTNQDLYNYFIGRCEPKFEKLALMSATMGVSMAWLTGYTKVNDTQGKGLNGDKLRELYIDFSVKKYA